MRFYEFTLFCDKEDRPRVHIAKGDSGNWPITLKINNHFDNFYTPRITLHFNSQEQLDYFISSANTAWRKLSKEVQDV